jgi:hypothetical protein
VSDEVKQYLAEQSIPEPMSGCWLWLASVDRGGYGQASVPKRLGAWTRKAHRLSFELHKGEVPDGLLVCHKCDTRSCVNPDHLYAGTPAQNTSDMIARGRAGRRAPRGSERPHSKLTEDAVREIRRRLRAGESHRAIAANFNVSRPAISFIARGVTWSHVAQENP